MSQTVLWLIRHPEPDVSARGLCYGSLDVALSDAGMKCARTIAANLVNERFSSIYASPRQRCSAAARILAEVQGCPLEIAHDLRELDFGAFEGRPYDELAAAYPSLYREWMENPAGVRFPGGETLCEMSVRVLDAVQEMLARHAGESIGIVSHGGPIRAILADALGIPAPNIFRIEQRYGALNRIRFREGLPSVELMNAASV